MNGRMNGSPTGGPVKALLAEAVLVPTQLLPPWLSSHSLDSRETSLDICVAAQLWPGHCPLTTQLESEVRHTWRIPVFDELQSSHSRAAGQRGPLGLWYGACSRPTGTVRVVGPLAHWYGACSRPLQRK